MKECSLQEQTMLGGFLGPTMGQPQICGRSTGFLAIPVMGYYSFAEIMLQNQDFTFRPTLGYTGQRFLVLRPMVMGGPMAYGPGHFMVPSSQCNFSCCFFAKDDHTQHFCIPTDDNAIFSSLALAPGFLQLLLETFCASNFSQP